jgi:histidinol dehydrogenase
MYKVYQNPDEEILKEALSRPVQKLKKIKKVVKPILKSVKNKGDIALIKFTREYDHVDLDHLQVSDSEIEAAIQKTSAELKEAISLASENIEKFHRAQQQGLMEVETMPGVVCRRKGVAIEKIGLYVPGGTAPLFSSVLMLAIPARIAGCSEIVLCTPPNKNGEIHPAILYAAKVSGVKTIVKVGGAQAIAAMAYGTKSVPKVYKIFGPGNQYVTAAKQLITQDGVAIDMPAGPSEVAVLADESSNPAFVASDLLSQAEHGIDSQVLLVSTDGAMIDKVRVEVEKQLEQLPRKRVASQSLDNSVAIFVNGKTRAMEIINQYAPEHLILATDDADSLAEKVINAGSIFLGHLTPESVGDYASGTNHTLPTNESALAYSGVSLDSYLKKITFQRLNKEGIRNLGPKVEVMAEAEGLTAHKNAVTLRLKSIENE